MELQPSADAPQILVADALYLLGRVEEAYRLLLAIGPTSPRAPILARLTLLQLHRGFLYDANQVHHYVNIALCERANYYVWCFNINSHSNRPNI